MSARWLTMQILVSLGVVGASPQIGEMLPPCDFFDSPVLAFFLDPAPRSNRWTDLHALWLKRRVSAQGWSFWGLQRWVTIFGANMPLTPTPPQWGWIGNFKPKRQNIKNRNISKTINRIKTKFEDRADTDNCTLWVVQHYPHQFQYGCLLPSWKNRYDVITPPTIIDRNRNLKLNSNMASVRFPKPEVVIFQPWIELSHRNLVCRYEGRPINKLQNGIIQLIFKIWKIRNIGFVRNLIGHIHWNFDEDDVIVVTSRVHRT